MRRLALLFVAITVAACGGIGIPHQQPGESYPGDRREVTGTIEIGPSGCIRLAVDGGGDFAVIWPASASQGEDDYVSLGWFTDDLGGGDRVRGTGALTPLEPLLATHPNGYWSDAIGGCVGEGETEVLVFDSAQGIDG